MGLAHSPGKITVDEYYEMARVGLTAVAQRKALVRVRGAVSVMSEPKSAALPGWRMSRSI